MCSFAKARELFASKGLDLPQEIYREGEVFIRHHLCWWPISRHDFWAVFYTPVGPLKNSNAFRISTTGRNEDFVGSMAARLEVARDRILLAEFDDPSPRVFYCIIINDNIYPVIPHDVCLGRLYALAHELDASEVFELLKKFSATRPDLVHFDGWRGGKS